MTLASCFRRLALRREIQAAVEGREPHRRSCHQGDERKERREVDAIGATQPMTLGEVSSLSPYLLHRQRKEAAPVPVDVSLGPRLLRVTQVTLPPQAGQSAPRLRIGQGRGRHDGGARELLSNRSAAIFLDIELDQAAGIEVEDQRRSSSTISDAVFPRTFGGSADPLGLPPPQLAAPVLTNSQANRASAPSSTGPRTATAAPRSVTTIRSPARARRRYALR
jgi:hypothetical protein